MVPDSGLARLHRWTLDPATGTVEEATLDDRGIEFPTIDDARVGRDARYRYAIAGGGLDGAAIVKFDIAAGVVAEHPLGPDVVAGEAVFVASESRSKLLVLDATDVGGAPVAAVTLPRRVPAGFHGSWITDDDLRTPIAQR